MISTLNCALSRDRESGGKEKQAIIPPHAFPSFVSCLSNMTAVLLLPDDDYASLALENPRLPSAMLNDKNGLLDVLAQTKSGRLIDIEIMPVAFYDPKRGSLFSGDLSLHTLELPKEHPDDETPPLSTTAHPNRS
jgi:hypothetical protein